MYAYLMISPAISSARSQFLSKFKDKSANHWDNRHNFVKKDGKYQYLERDYGTDEPEGEGSNAAGL